MLKGQHVVVIGGSSGIGLATVAAAARAGAQVTAMGRSRERLEAARSRYSQVRAVSIDVCSDSSVQEAFAPLDAIDHVFISAGTVTATPLLSAPFDALQQPFNERVFGAMRVVRAALPKMLAGSVTFTTGDLVDRPVPMMSAVSAAAAAVESLAKTCALELAPIRFNVLSPGAVDTPLYTALFGEQREAALTAQGAKLPGKRVGSAAELAAAALALMSNDYINAAVLHVDGATRFV